MEVLQTKEKYLACNYKSEDNCHSYGRIASSYHHLHLPCLFYFPVMFTWAEKLSICFCTCTWIALALLVATYILFLGKPIYLYNCPLVKNRCCWLTVLKDIWFFFNFFLLSVEVLFKMWPTLLIRACYNIPSFQLNRKEINETVSLPNLEWCFLPVYYWKTFYFLFKIWWGKKKVQDMTFSRVMQLC